MVVSDDVGCVNLCPQCSWIFVRSVSTCSLTAFASSLRCPASPSLPAWVPARLPPHAVPAPSHFHPRTQEYPEVVPPQGTGLGRVPNPVPGGGRASYVLPLSPRPGLGLQGLTVGSPH
ncbi:hypothetical protein Pmani_036189 [Petrolisthes manimaculis]|uniref:Uncharacterized protein n=1 Tax=Petrolisthes manimaculis TaxID=1843537 RepID=A0AAE1NKT7_9EUCA|nr:hypothetical protein Pmani_036189 [Petrolisthes manimaculis]